MQLLNKQNKGEQNFFLTGGKQYSSGLGQNTVSIGQLENYNGIANLDVGEIGGILNLPNADVSETPSLISISNNKSKPHKLLKPSKRPRPSGCIQDRGQFPSDKSCSHFLNCWDGVVVTQECPRGLLFNEITGECDYDHEVDCGVRPILSIGIYFLFIFNLISSYMVNRENE